MVDMPEYLNFSYAYYCTEVEIDFYIDDDSLTWHITVDFVRPISREIIASYSKRKRNMHLREALNEVYWEINNEDLPSEQGMDTIHFTSQILEEDYYRENIYPLIVRLRSESKDLTKAQIAKIIEKTKYL